MAARSKRRKSGKKSKGKILFVEDDKFLAEMFRQKFVIEGYEPIVAHTAVSAVLALKEENPIAILLDIVLPDSECWMIMEYLLRKQHYTPVPVIIITNYGSPEYRKKAKQLQADAFYIKANITPDELVKAMEELIRKKKHEKHEPYRSPIL